MNLPGLPARMEHAQYWRGNPHVICVLGNCPTSGTVKQTHLTLPVRGANLAPTLTFWFVAAKCMYMLVWNFLTFR